MKIKEQEFLKLINKFDSLVTDEHEIGIGHLGELREELEANNGVIKIPPDITKSGEEEIIIINHVRDLEKFYIKDIYLISIHADIWEDYDRTKDLWSFAVYFTEDFLASNDGEKFAFDAILEGFSYETFAWCKEVAFNDLQEMIDNNFNEYSRG